MSARENKEVIARTAAILAQRSQKEIEVQKKEKIDSDLYGQIEYINHIILIAFKWASYSGEAFSIAKCTFSSL